MGWSVSLEWVTPIDPSLTVSDDSTVPPLTLLQEVHPCFETDFASDCLLLCGSCGSGNWTSVSLRCPPSRLTGVETTVTPSLPKNKSESFLLNQRWKTSQYVCECIGSRPVTRPVKHFLLPSVSGDGPSQITNVFGREKGRHDGGWRVLCVCRRWESNEHVKWFA